MVPWFQYCTDLWFTGYDPPKTLVPAAAMAPPITSSDPKTSIATPQASATQDPGVKETNAVWPPIPIPPPPQHAPSRQETSTLPKVETQVPKETNDIPITWPQAPQSKPVNNDLGANHQDSGSMDPSESSNIQSNNSGDPKVPGDSSGHSNVQAGGSGDSRVQIDPNRDESNDPSSPSQKQGINPGQVATNPGSRQSSQNRLVDSEGPVPTSDTIPRETTITLTSHAVVVGPYGVHVDGVDVNPNQPPVTLSGVAALNQGNSIVLASQIFHLPAPTELAPIMIAGPTVIPIANGVSIQGTPVTGTSPVLISGTTVSVYKSHVYIGSESYPLPTVSPTPVMTLANGAAALPMSNAVSIDGTTLTAGAPAATISGTAVSLDSSSNLIFDGTAQALPSFPQPTHKSNQITTINNVVVQLLSSGISIAGTTLTPGAPAIIASGSLISLGSTVLAIGTTSVPVSFGTPKTLITTIGGQPITAGATGIRIGSVTLTPGAQGITLGGTLISLGASGSLVVGSKTVMLGVPTGSLGSMIKGGFGSGVSLTKSSSPSGVVPTSTSNFTSPRVQSFEGRAAHSLNLLPKTLTGIVVAIYLILYTYL